MIDKTKKFVAGQMLIKKPAEEVFEAFIAPASKEVIQHGK